MSVLIGRRFYDELAAQIQKNVTIITVNGKSYSGVLIGYDQETMSICLANANDERTGKVMPRLFLNGRIISEIYSTGKSFDFKALADKLEKVFPRMVKHYEEANVIVVMNKIRVGEKGLIEGSGPAAERVQKVYDDYVKEQAKQ